MDELKLPLLHKAVQELIAYISTLSTEEKVVVDMVEFNAENYEGASLGIARHGNKMPSELRLLDLQAEKDCRDLIQSCQDDLVKFYQKEQGFDPQSRIFGLLKRYITLSNYWRVYVCARIDPDYESKVSERKDQGDLSIREDRWIFKFFGAMAHEIDEKDGDVEGTVFDEVVSKLDVILKEVEFHSKLPEI